MPGTALACVIDGCSDRREAHGFCVKHLRRWLRHGDPRAVVQIQGDDDARFRARVRVDAGGCWLWMGSLLPNGYARFTVGRVRFLAHRWSYTRFRGAIPGGLQIDHLCRVRHGVNPAHLEPVDARENTLRSPYAQAAVNAAKTVCLRGHPLNSANTYRSPATGHRRCRVCKRLQERLRRRAERSV
ncbi:HNH endonuclease signature motif containing protein [Actinophytocola sediminis]